MQEYEGGSLFSPMWEDQRWTDTDLNDDYFTELCRKFRDDQSRLSVVYEELGDYCQHVKQFCGCLKRCIPEFEPFMETPSSTAYPFIQSKWVQLSTTYHHSLEDLDAILDSFVCRFKTPPTNSLLWEQILSGEGADMSVRPASSARSFSSHSITSC